MNILITNDDGIDSPGLYRLAKAAAKLGKVWVIAPDGQRSANSHRITLTDTIDVYPVHFPIQNVQAYATTGTPADCIRFGMQNYVEGKTDLVLSGINFGFNVGGDIQYSATAAAALEAASLGIQAIALSEAAAGKPDVSSAYLDTILEKLIPCKLPRNSIWNVNFPNCPIDEFQGILWDRTVNPSGIYEDWYEKAALEYGGIRLTVRGNINTTAAPGSDYAAVLSNHISIGIVKNIG